MIQIKKLPLIAAILFGVLAVMLVAKYIKDRERMLEQGVIDKIGNIGIVVVATRNIEPGETIEENMVKPIELPEKTIAPGTANSPDRFIGRTAATMIYKDEQIPVNKIGTPQGIGVQGPPKAQTLADKLPKGMRAIVISADAMAAAGGRLSVDDRVDVIALIPMPSMSPSGQQTTDTINLPIFQNVQVVDVSGGSMSGAGLVTLALGPEEAALMTYAQDHVKLKLLLRARGDENMLPPQVINWDLFQQYLFGPQPTPPPQPRPIEIYRGGESAAQPKGGQ